MGPYDFEPDADELRSDWEEKNGIYDDFGETPYEDELDEMELEEAYDLP